MVLEKQQPHILFFLTFSNVESLSMRMKLPKVSPHLIHQRWPFKRGD